MTKKKFFIGPSRFSYCLRESTLLKIVMKITRTVAEFSTAEYLSLF